MSLTVRPSGTVRPSVWDRPSVRRLDRRASVVVVRRSSPSSVICRPLSVVVPKSVVWRLASVVRRRSQVPSWKLFKAQMLRIQACLFFRLIRGWDDQPLSPAVGGILGVGNACKPQCPKDLCV